MNLGNDLLPIIDLLTDKLERKFNAESHAFDAVEPVSPYDLCHKLQKQLSHFQVPFCLIFKMSLCPNPFK